MKIERQFTVRDNGNTTTMAAKKTTICKVLCMSGAALGAVMILVLLLLPVLLTSGAGRRFMLRALNKRVDGEVDFAVRSVGWRRGIVAENLSFESRCGDISFQAVRISIRPSYLSLLRGRVEPAETVVFQPRLRLNVSGAGSGHGSAGDMAGKPAPRRQAGRGLEMTLNSVELFLEGFSVSVMKGEREIGRADDIGGEIHIRTAGEGGGPGGCHVRGENFRITALSFSPGGGDPVVLEHLAAAFDVSLAPDAGGGDFHWDVLGAGMGAEGRFEYGMERDGPRVECRGDVRYDWQEIPRLLGSFWPEGLEVTGERNDGFAFSGLYPLRGDGRMLENLSGTFRTGFANAGYMGLEFAETALRVDVEEGMMTLHPFETSVNGGTVRFACTADLARAPLVLHLQEPMEIVSDVPVNKMLSHKLLRRVNPLFADHISVGGKAGLNNERMALVLGEGCLDGTFFQGTFSAEQVQLGGAGLLGAVLSVAGISPARELITVRPTRVVLDGGVLTYENMQVEVGRYPLIFSGSVSIEDGGLDMEVVLPYTASGKTVRVGEAVAGRRVVVPLGGTIDSPEIDVRGALGRGLLEENLRRGLEMLF